MTDEQTIQDALTGRLGRHEHVQALEALDRLVARAETAERERDEAREWADQQIKRGDEAREWADQQIKRGDDEQLGRKAAEARVAALEAALEDAIQVIEWCGLNDKTPTYTYDPSLKSTRRPDGSLPERGCAFNTPREFARYWPEVLRIADPQRGGRMTPLDEIKRIRDAATPGPWTPGKTWRTILGERKQDVVDAEGREVGHSWFSEADARLIALAPELADRLIAAEERAEIAAEEAASLAAANESLLARAETLLWQLEQRADFGARLDDERVAAEQRVAELEEALRKIADDPVCQGLVPVHIARAALAQPDEEEKP